MHRTKNKTPSLSETIKTEIVCPNDTNPVGILMGGRLVEWMDVAAAVCAQIHSDKVCVTAMINKVSFREAAKVGDVITIRAKITRAFRTSMEIKVTATARNYLSANIYEISDAYFTFVGLNDRGKSTEVPTVNPESESEKFEYEQALVRKNAG